jgi:hypothetical protein
MDVLSSLNTSSIEDWEAYEAWGVLERIIETVRFVSFQTVNIQVSLMLQLIPQTHKKPKFALPKLPPNP